MNYIAQLSGMSTPLPEPVVQWLFKVIQPIYKQPKLVFHDAVQTLTEFKNLRPRTRVFTDEDGSPRLLLCLYGGIHIEQGLDVPVLIWIPESYPIAKPLLFIDLELLGKDLQLATNESVEPDGRVHTRLLRQWNPQSANLFNVIQDLADMCNAIAPIQPVTFSSTVAPGTTDAEKSPPVPPKPALPPKTTDNAIKFAGQTSSIPGPNGIPKIPERMPLQNPTQETDTTIRPSKASINPTGNGTMGPPPLPEKPQQSNALHDQLRQLNLQEPPHHDDHANPVQNTQRTFVDAVPNEVPMVDLLDSMDEKPVSDAYTQSLEKLKMTIHELSTLDQNYKKEQIESRIPQLQTAIKQFDDLYNHESEKLNWIKSSIIESRESLQKGIEDVDKETLLVEKFIAENGTTLDSNTVYTTEVPALDQLYTLVARDRALTDTIQVLARLLNCGALEFDAFIKKVRELARDQFMARLHIRKIIALLQE